MPIHIKRALLSVSDKSGLGDFARFLSAMGVELVSTGGTAKFLKAEGLPVRDVADVTAFPEMMDGRVKTLHPKIHGGILADRDVPAHMNDLEKHAIGTIDMVVVNLYPFRETVMRGAAFDECVENIDIGGPSMIRAAAKNHKHVAVITSPAQYDGVRAELENGKGHMDTGFCRVLAAEAFAHSAAYDAQIARWFDDGYGREKAFSGHLVERLRYGENAHQSAALYSAGGKGGIANARQVQGKPLSYNNINDADAAWACVGEFSKPAAVIIKHANPCGVAVANDITKAFERALAADNISAFGGIVALNRMVDAPTAKLLADIFLEVILAPSYAPEALEILAKKQNLRVLIVEEESQKTPCIKSVSGGFLVQDQDAGMADPATWNMVTKAQPSPALRDDLLFGMQVCKHVKSNAITLVKDGMTIGVGAGQMSRVDAARIAVAKAVERHGSAVGCVAASDAFLPFSDTLDILAEAGVKALIQPGGSVKDEDVIARADALGFAMVFSAIRHFRH